ncbi:hypothetical protein Ae717Ps2_6284 [Pseudonocardia sp. Ae717_Ps2]|nr:hypothetical protein Ae717Ps2_6143 [Pseudonocardia sp. Ae717_Ps2]OLM28688.1 hypothetical protein Ae717Ps2_6284 [Pseudonocardia sp. Ae717_Ps2]
MKLRPRRTATPPPAPAIPVLAPGQLWCTKDKLTMAELAGLAERRSAARPMLVTDVAGQHTSTSVVQPAEAITSTPRRSAVLVTAVAVAVPAAALAQLALRHSSSSRIVGRRPR